MKLVTNRDLNGDNPLFPSSPFNKDFIMLNMWTDGIWLVDKQHPQFEQIKTTALEIAKSFGDKKTIEKLEALASLRMNRK